MDDVGRACQSAEGECTVKESGIFTLSAGQFLFERRGSAVFNVLFTMPGASPIVRIRHSALDIHNVQKTENLRTAGPTVVVTCSATAVV